MSDPFIYYLKDAERIYNEQLSFRFAACSRQDDTVIVTEDLRDYCNIIESVIKNYLKAKSTKKTLLEYKNILATRNLTNQEKDKIIKLKEVRQTITYIINNDMKKICELFDRLSNQFHDERNDCEYSANYDNEKKIWKFIKK